MSREKALEEFKSGYVRMKNTEKVLELKEYFDKNKDKLALEFIESLKNMFIKIYEMQSKNSKGKIAYITYSMLRTEILQKNYMYLVEAFDKSWFLDDKRCSINYDSTWAFKFLDEFEEALEKKRIEYMNLITSADVEKIKLEEAQNYNYFIKELAKYSLENSKEIEEFEKIDKEEKMQIRVGEYMDVSEVVYKL